MQPCKDCKEHTGLEQRVEAAKDAAKDANGKLKWFIMIIVLVGIAFGGFQGKLFFKVADVDKASAKTQTSVEHMKEDVGTIKKSLKSIEKNIQDFLIANGGSRDGEDTN